MQQTMKEKMIPVRFDHEQVQAIDEVMGKIGARSRSEFVREAVRHYLDTVKEMKIIRVRSLSKDQARREIVDYLKEKKEAETFDIANDLRLDLEITMQALRELWEEGRIK